MIFSESWLMWPRKNSTSSSFSVKSSLSEGVRTFSGQGSILEKILAGYVHSGHRTVFLDTIASTAVRTRPQLANAAITQPSRS